MTDLKLIDGEDDGFLTTRRYRSRYGDICELKYEGGADDQIRVWYWRVNDGEWSSPVHKKEAEIVIPEDEYKPDGHHAGGVYYSDMGKMRALLEAAHHLGRSGEDCDWQPHDV